MPTFTSDIAKLTVATVDIIFNRETERPYEMYYPNICMQKYNEKNTGTYQQIGGIPGAYVKAPGSTYTFGKITDSYQTTITVQTYANAVGAVWEALCDDLYGVCNATFGAPLMQTIIDLREQAVADEYNDGFATTGADGVYHFSASHPLENSVLLNSNLATSATMGVDSIKAMKNMFYDIKNQAGRPFRTRPTHVLFHPDQMFTYTEIFGSQLMAFELSNTKNSLPQVVPLAPLVSLYLNEAPWYMLDRSLEAGVVFQRQEDLVSERWWEKNNAEYRASVRERWGTGIIAGGFGIIANAGV